MEIHGGSSNLWILRCSYLASWAPLAVSPVSPERGRYQRDLMLPKVSNESPRSSSLVCQKKKALNEESKVDQIGA